MFKFVLLNMELRRGARPESSGYPFKIVVVLHQKIDFVFGVLESIHATLKLHAFPSFSLPFLGLKTAHYFETWLECDIKP